MRPVQKNPLALAISIFIYRMMVQVYPLSFRQKYGVEIVQEWRTQWETYVTQGLVILAGDRIELTRAGLLQVDGLLPPFFEPQHQGVRYT